MMTGAFEGPQQPRLYKKDNSFEGLTGLAADHQSVLRRIEELFARLDTLGLDTARRHIVDLACRALLGKQSDGAPEFHLRAYIVEEIGRLPDDDLPRYLFYRYRYDVYPNEHIVDAFPPCVQIEPTSICNYRCVFCYQTDRNLTQGRHGHMGMMSLDTFKQVVDQIEGKVEAVTLASRGEPLISKDIKPMLAYAAGKFLGLKINTNGSMLDEGMAHAILQAEPNTLVFSADAADPELYRKLRVNGDFDKVVENIRRFREIKVKDYPNSKTILRISGVHFSNEQDFSEVENFWKELVDQVAFVAYNPWENAYDQPANGIVTPCSDLWRRAFVWWDGRVNPCDVDYRSTLSVGTIKDNALSDLWTGGAYAKLREGHLAGRRSDFMPCRGCAVV